MKTASSYQRRRNIMRHARKKLILLLAATLLSGLLALPLCAQVTSTPSEAQSDRGQKAGNEWKFTIVPYVWFAGISGDVTAKDRTTHVSVPFSEILNNLDFGGMVQVEARKDRWGIFFQGNYLKLTPTGSVSKPAAVDLIEGGPAVRDAEVRNNTQMMIAEFGGSYRLGSVGYTLNGQKSATFDMLAGARYWYFQSYTSLNLPQRGFSVSDTLYGNIIDPMIGLRMETYFARNFFVDLRGDAAGFGISNNSSHISWNGLGMIGYDISPRATVLAGYRLLYINYTPGGGSNVRLTIQGPAAGFGYKF
jgi:hypothetical protein